MDEYMLIQSYQHASEDALIINFSETHTLPSHMRLQANSQKSATPLYAFITYGWTPCIHKT